MIRLKKLGGSGRTDKVMAVRPLFFSLLLLLAILSSAVALGYQLLWTRRLIDIIGAGTESTARVFGCFFLGLSLGAAVARPLVARVPHHPFLLLASAEIAIAVLSIPLFLLPAWIPPASATNGLSAFIISATAIIPPALLMGLFLPVLMIALGTMGYRLGGGGLWLYAANTIGGVAGLTLLLVWVIPRFGPTPSWGLLITGNIVTAIFFCFFQSRYKPSESNPLPAETTIATTSNGKERAQSRSVVLLLSFLSGWFILAWEIVALQALFLQVTITFHTPGAILMSVLLLLAIGAGGVASLSHRICVKQWLPRVVLLTAAMGTITPLLFFFFSNTGLGTPSGGSFVFWLRLVGLTLLIFGPVFFAASFWFPLLTEWWDRLHHQNGATRWGWLLALNGIGGLLGAECAYRILLPLLGPFSSMGALALASLAVLLILFRDNELRLHQFPITFVSACALASFLLWASVSWFPQLPVVNPHAQFKILAHWSDRTGNLAVVERADIGRGLLLNNQYMLGTTSLASDKTSQTHIALATHPNPRQVATLGMATGISAGAALGVEGVRSIDVFELSGSVIAAAEFFKSYNRDLVNAPTVTIHKKDARNGVSLFQNHFDVIIGDLFLPWGIGEARLFSIEHFRSVYNALASDGVFVQWLPLYQLGAEEFAIIQKTFSEVFPSAWQLRLHLRNDQPVIGLFGRKQVDLSNDPRPQFHSHSGNDTARLSRLWPQLELGPIRDLTVDDSGNPVPINTLSNMWVERLAAQRLASDPARQTYLNYQALGL